MAYGIMRVEKRHMEDVLGLQLEACRTSEDHGRAFEGSEIDWTKTNQNVFLCQSKSWKTSIEHICDEAGIKPRKDAVVMIDAFYGLSKEWCETHTRAEQIAFFKDCLSFHEQHYGTVFSAVIHFDETTPHMQVASVPVFADETGKAHLSAKALLGAPKDYCERQDQFYAEVCQSRGLDRGEKSTHTKAKHKTALEHKTEMASQALSEASQALSEARAEETALRSSISELQGDKEALNREVNELEHDPLAASLLQLDAVKQTMKETVLDLESGKTAYDVLAPEVNKKTLDPLWRAEHRHKVAQKQGYEHDRDSER